MGTAFSSNESVTQSPNRSRPNTVANNRQIANRPAASQRIYNPNAPVGLRRASANPSGRYQSELDDSIGYIYYDRSDNARRPIQIGNHPSTSQSVQPTQSRPFSFGGDLSIMHFGPESDPEHDRHSLNARLFYMPFPGQDRKCSICKRIVPFDNYETHYVMCFTKPRVTFNEDVLTEDQGECVICLVDLVQGDVIARLPCLCIYHKRCIEDWFQRSQTCPSHPDFIEPPR